MIKNVYFAGLLAAGLSSLAFSSSAADISGKVKLQGTPKPEIPIQLDPTCGKIAFQPHHDPALRGGEGQRLGKCVCLCEGRRGQNSCPKPTGRFGSKWLHV